MECTFSPKSENDLLDLIWKTLQRSRFSRVETEAEHLAVIENGVLGAYGEVTSGYPKTGAGVDQSIYIGQLYDAESNLSYLNARYYDGSRGQFLSQDPVFLSSPLQQQIQDPQSLNAYSYSDDNPITKSDPSGKCFEDGCVAEIAAASLYAQYLGTAAPIIAEDYSSLQSDSKQHDFGGAALAGLGLAADLVPGGDDLRAASGIALGTDFGKLGTVVDQVVTDVSGYTDHGLLRKSVRGVPTSDVVNAVRNPDVVLQQAGGTYLHVTEDAAVAVNKSGQVVTTYASSEYNSTLNYIQGEINQLKTQIANLTKTSGK